MLASITTQAQRQAELKNVKDLLGYTAVPQEKVFIHYNTSLLFSGEYLYYRVYCFDTKSNLSSKISKIAYVILLDESGKSIFEHKVQLKNGLGQGDFFMPVSVPSGNYKLIAYTQWMLNADAHFYEGDISILNPYQADQNAIVSQKITKDSISNLGTAAAQLKAPKTTSNSNTIVINSDNQNYKNRSKVKLTLESATVGYGNYSVSVRKKDRFDKAEMISSESFSKMYGAVKSKSKPIKSSFFLPELRGELIYGKIVPKDPSVSMAIQSIGFSLSGKASDLQIISTDDDGNFIFNLHNRKGKEEILSQVIGDARSDYTIVFDEIPEIKPSNLNFYQFKVSPEFEQEILNRSINNQIDNNFYSVKPDTIQQPKPSLPFYGKNKITYNLDEYNRFNTIRETIVEVVASVWTRKDDNGKEVFTTRGYYDGPNDTFLPLLIVDGTYIQDHEEVIDLDATKVKSISLIRDRYYLGNQIFAGVLVIETFDNDFASLLTKDYIQSISLSSLENDKKYFVQQYSDDNPYDRIPDYRSQLLWNPNLAISNKNATLEFYTSDVKGDFEICLEGFTNSGLPVSIKKYITVQ